jgi:hypothetical protein
LFISLHVLLNNYQDNFPPPVLMQAMKGLKLDHF